MPPGGALVASPAGYEGSGTQPSRSNGFMSSWDSGSPTSVAVAKDLSVPVPFQPLSVDVEGRSSHFLWNSYASVGCQTNTASPIG